MQPPAAFNTQPTTRSSLLSSTRSQLQTIKTSLFNNRTWCLGDSNWHTSQPQAPPDWKLPMMNLNLKSYCRTLRCTSRLTNHIDLTALMPSHTHSGRAELGHPQPSICSHILPLTRSGLISHTESGQLPTIKTSLFNNWTWCFRDSHWRTSHPQAPPEQKLPTMNRNLASSYPGSYAGDTIPNDVLRAAAQNWTAHLHQGACPHPRRGVLELELSATAGPFWTPLFHPWTQILSLITRKKKDIVSAPDDPVRYTQSVIIELSFRPALALLTA